MTDSPDFLGQAPSQGQSVPRLNRVPLLIAGILLLLIIGAITYTYQMRLASLREEGRRTAAEPSAATPSEVFKDAPDGGMILARKGEHGPPPPVKAEPEKPALTPPGPDPEALARERERQARERLEAARVASALQALKAPTTVKHAKFVAGRGGTRPRADAAPSSDGHLRASYAAAMRRRMLMGEEGKEDVNRAAEKAAWLKDRQPQKADKHYLPEGRVGPRSPYELKAGTVIPAIMVGGINSDLPGQILAQVRENVYDTATGRHILIPQGAKLVGTYDNAITTGQERVLVAWTRIIYPDASSIDLGKMPGADSAGLAGLKDRVDNHFWKAFGNALLMSVFSAGVQISQGGGSSSTNGMNAQQSIAAGLGQQLGQLGQEMARRNVKVQPTIEIRPGLHFTVMATRDAVISPWRPRRANNGG